LRIGEKNKRKKKKKEEETTAAKYNGLPYWTAINILWCTRRSRDGSASSIIVCEIINAI